MLLFLIEDIVVLNRVEKLKKKKKDSSGHEENNCIEMDNEHFYIVTYFFY